MTKVQLELTPIGDGSKVLLDGQDYAGGIRSLTLHCGPGPQLTTMTLELNLADVTPVHGEAEIVIPPATRQLLAKLGWTPPKPDAG